MRQVENVQMNLRQCQIHKVMSYKITKATPKDLSFSKGIFSGFIFCAVYVQTFEFSIVKIGKRISQRVRSYYSYKLRLLNELRVRTYLT